MTHSVASFIFSKTKIFIALSTATVLLTACGSSDSKLKSETSELDIAAVEVIDNTIIPAATRFQQQTQALADSSTNFCATGNINTENLSQVQEQWKATHAAWFELLPYRFGPMINGLLSSTYMYIDSYRNNGDKYTGTVRTTITNLLANNSLSATTFENLSPDRTGLLALEVTLFENSATQSQVPSEIISEFDGSNKCQILTGYATELVRNATIIQQGWVNNYRNTGKNYRELVINGQLKDTLDDETDDIAIKRITVSVQNFYDYLANRNLTTDTAQLAGSIWQSLERALKNTEELLQGTSATTISLNQIMNGNRFEQTVVDLQSNIKTLRTALIDESSINMKAAAAAIDGNFKRELPDALNITLGLNFSDGD